MTVEKSNSVFMTGGSGFIGRSLIPVLREHGYKVFALVRSNAAGAVVRELGAYAIPGSMYHYGNLKNTMQLCDYVVHLAGHMKLSGDPKDFYTTNVEGTRNMLDAARDSGVRKFLYVGAASVINGKKTTQVDESYMPPKLPTDLYSETKYVAEQATLKADSASMHTLVLRPPFVWGPDNSHADMIRDSVENGWFRWIGGGDHYLSTCHVKNLAAAILAALESDKGGKVYFVTDGEERRFKDFFRAYAYSQGIELPDKSLPRWLALALAKILQRSWKSLKLHGEPPVLPVLVYLLGTQLTVSDANARQDLGYEPIISIDQGLKELHDPSLN